MRGAGFRRLAAIAFLLAAPPGAAQERPALLVTLPPRDSVGEVGPLVRASHVLDDRRIRELMDHGFPARLHYRVELWTTGGLFNRMLRAVEWDLGVRYDPMGRTFEAVRVTGDSVSSLGVFRDYTSAAAEVERAYRPVFRPPPSGARLYYNVTLTLEMMSVGDLDELVRWVRGDLGPAVRGQRNPGTALGRGARTLVSRLLGGERRTLEARSPRFTVPVPDR
ncbi:MAG: hypothetical protein IT361_00530 [Gemmatimonadaceae bacterium]|nr:hypothetical protein [Gemmatimonadaceae bacterium]